MVLSCNHSPSCDMAGHSQALQASDHPFVICAEISFSAVNIPAWREGNPRRESPDLPYQLPTPASGPAKQKKNTRGGDEKDFFETICGVICSPPSYTYIYVDGQAQRASRLPRRTASSRARSAQHTARSRSRNTDCGRITDCRVSLVGCSRSHGSPQYNWRTAGGSPPLTATWGKAGSPPKL